jgi:hypothetical protein
VRSEVRRGGEDLGHPETPQCIKQPCRRSSKRYLYNAEPEHHRWSNTKIYNWGGRKRTRRVIISFEAGIVNKNSRRFRNSPKNVGWEEEEVEGELERLSVRQGEDC